MTVCDFAADPFADVFGTGRGIPASKDELASARDAIPAEGVVSWNDAPAPDLNSDEGRALKQRGTCSVCAISTPVVYGPQRLCSACQFERALTGSGKGKRGMAR